jgi:uncharacterized DUF497 family protein
MEYFEWDPQKNEKLKLERGISFEDIVTAHDEGNVLDVVEHHNQKLHPGQKLIVAAIRDYVYLIPFVEDGQKVFLKTVIPSRKATKLYIDKGTKNKSF